MKKSLYDRTFELIEKFAKNEKVFNGHVTIGEHDRNCIVFAMHKLPVYVRVFSHDSKGTLTFTVRNGETIIFHTLFDFEVYLKGCTK
jgi:hypothetical protein